jgi:O-antigen/teichoic acid export membrane protein
MTQDNQKQPLRDKAKKSLFWVVISSITNQSMGFVVSIILARLLDPAEIGLFGLTGTVIALATIFGDVGFGRSIIQKKVISPKTIDTAYSINFILSTIFGMLVFLTSPWIAAFYDELQLDAVLKVLSLNIIFITLGNIPRNLLERRFAFKRRTWIDVIPQIGYALTAIVLANFGFGVWSLVYSTLTSAILRLVIAYRLTNFSFSFAFDIGDAKALWDYGKFLVYGSLLLFVASNLDQIYIGRYINVENVGYYGLALTIGNISTDYVARLFGQVLFPVFSRIQSSVDQLQEAYLVSIRFITYLSAPIMFGLIAVAPMAVIVVYGSKWKPATPFIIILSIYGFFRSVGSVTGPYFNGIGKPNVSLRILILRLLLLVIFLFPLGKFFAGKGVAISLTLSMFISVVWSFLLINKELDIPASKLFQQILPQFTSALIMFIFVFVFVRFIKTSFISLGLSVLLGVATYFFTLWILIRDQLKKDIQEAISPIIDKLVVFDLFRNNVNS